MKNQIDSFHRRLIRSHILNVRWPKIVKNNEVYEKTKLKPWSKRIELKRMKWFGHLIRLDEYTPARKALRIALTKSKKTPGKQKLTWVELMKKQLEAKHLSWEEACKKATEDRENWKKLCYT